MTLSLGLSGRILSYAGLISAWCVFMAAAAARPQNIPDEFMLDLVLSRPSVHADVLFESDESSESTFWGLKAVCSVASFLQSCLPRQVTSSGARTDCKPTKYIDGETGFLVLTDDLKPTDQRLDGYCLSAIFAGQSDAQVMFLPKATYGPLLRVTCGPECEGTFSSRHNSVDVQLLRPISVEVSVSDVNGNRVQRRFSPVKAFRLVGSEEVARFAFLAKKLDVRGGHEIHGTFPLTSKKPQFPEVFTWSGNPLPVAPEKLTSLYLRSRSTTSMVMRAQGGAAGGAISVRSQGIGQIVANGSRLLRTKLFYDKKSLGPYRISQQELRSKKRNRRISIKLKQTAAWMETIDLIGIHVASSDPDIGIVFTDSSVLHTIHAFFSENYAFFETLESKFDPRRASVPSGSTQTVSDKTRQIICENILVYMKEQNEIDNETFARLVRDLPDILYSLVPGDDPAIFLALLDDVRLSDFLGFLEKQTSKSSTPARSGQLDVLGQEGATQFREWLRTRLEHGVENLNVERLDFDEDLELKGKLYSSNPVEIGRHTLQISVSGGNFDDVQIPIAIDVYDKYALLKSALKYLGTFLAGLFSKLFSDKLKLVLEKILERLRKLHAQTPAVPEIPSVPQGAPVFNEGKIPQSEAASSETGSGPKM
jgi:hypothetical protein